MNISCPFCEQETQIDKITQQEQFAVRDETILIDRTYYRCTNCGEEFEIHTEGGEDPYDLAYREYRRRKGWLQPEEIKAFRESLGLTQQQLSDLLGIGIATLNRYENGALQTAAHQQLLSYVIKEPSLLLTTIEQKPELLTGVDRTKLRDRLNELQNPNSKLLEQLIQSYASYEPNHLSGEKQLDFTKLLQTFKYFCHNSPVYKTKLNKLMFYADFLYFREYGESITGLRYAHATFGPIPDNYDSWLAVCTNLMNELKGEEVMTDDFVGETFKSLTPPDLNAFQPNEIIILQKVKEKFLQFSSKQITEYSHQEEGYIKTANGDLIPYSYAEDLRI